MGALVWALNSIWKGPAWGAISKGGALKVVAYRLKRAMEAHHLSFVAPVSPSAYRVPPQPSSCKMGNVCLHFSKHTGGTLRKNCSLVATDYKTGKAIGASQFTVSLPEQSPIGSDVYSSEITNFFERHAPSCSKCRCACYLPLYSLNLTTSETNKLSLRASSLLAATRA